jgi:microcompartment protein CcmK/EutM
VRVGLVQGRIVLGVAAPEIEGTTLLIVEPVTSDNLRLGTTKGGGVALILADQLGAHEGQLVGIVEGREAANPYWPEPAPVDAYCALIIDNLDYHPPVGMST